MKIAMEAHGFTAAWLPFMHDFFLILAYAPA